MDARKKWREEKKEELLRQLAALEIEELREQGVFDGTPHYSALEGPAHELGKRLSRCTQERAAEEVGERCPPRISCPGCGEMCVVQRHEREVRSLDGPVRVVEAAAYCGKCRRSFFPSASSAGV